MTNSKNINNNTFAPTTTDGVWKDEDGNVIAKTAEGYEVRLATGITVKSKSGKKADLTEALTEALQAKQSTAAPTEISGERILSALRLILSEKLDEEEQEKVGGCFNDKKPENAGTSKRLVKQDTATYEAQKEAAASIGLSWNQFMAAAMAAAVAKPEMVEAFLPSDED